MFLNVMENITAEEEINVGDALYFHISVSPVIDDTTKEIVYRDYVDISVAVATPKVRRVLITATRSARP